MRAPQELEDWVDQVDVPAAVVCAFCGNADCTGCDQERWQSGIVAVVAWERPGLSWRERLWWTARATAFDAERFFEGIPDGPVAPALRFAVACELLASTAMLIALALPVTLVLPAFVRQALFEARGLLLRELFVLVASITTLLVGAHAAHGLAIHRSARRLGIPSSRTRALRFGLYAAGWDLVIGPLGWLVTAIKEGPRPAMELGGLAFGLPTRCTRAFLRGVYRLDTARFQKVLRGSYAVVLLAAIGGAIGVLGAAVIVAVL